MEGSLHVDTVLPDDRWRLTATPPFSTPRSEHRTKKLPRLWKLFRLRAMTTILNTRRADFRGAEIFVWSSHIVFYINTEVMNTMR
jgi:hypothetical protein